MPLLTAAEFLKRYDSRPVAQRLLDDGTDAEDSDLTTGGTDAGDRLRACIDDAEGLFVGAAVVGGRYSRADLQTVVELDSGENPTAKLIFRVLSDIAYGNVLKRRSLPAAEFAQLAPAYDEAMGFLEQLRRGERVLADVPGVPEAGLPDTVSNVPRPGIDELPLWSQSTKLFGDLGGPWN